MASSDPDLYPPDSTDRSPEARSARNRAFLGVFLVTWGSGLLAERALHTHLDTFGLAVGLGLLAAWNQWRRYGWFVAGAIVTGSGVGSFLSSLIGHGALGSAIAAFGTAAGFFAVFVRYPTRSTWSLIPAGIFGVIGVGALGLGLAGLIGHHVAGFLLPGLVISAGVLLVFKGSMPRKTRRILLLCLAGLFLLVASSSGFGNGFPGAGFGSFQQTVNVPLPQLAEGHQTLVLRDGTGDVHVTTGDTQTPMATIVLETWGPRNRRPNFQAVTEGSRVVLESVRGRDDFWGMHSVDYTIVVPPKTSLDIRTTTGDVSVDATANPTIDVHTASGDIDINGTMQGRSNMHVGGSEGDGLIQVRTTTGHVEVMTVGSTSTTTAPSETSTSTSTSTSEAA